jgi:hypothetical protein
MSKVLGGKMLDTAGAAAYIGVATTTLHAWRSRGQVGPRYIRIGRGRCIRYRIADLEKYLNEHAVESGGAR